MVVKKSISLAHVPPHHSSRLAVAESILTGEAIGRDKLALLGHGGLYRNCKQCRYSICSFGKA